MSKLSDLKVRVEAQQGHCRAMAIGLQALAETGVLLATERRLVELFADQATVIASALGEAVRDADGGQLDALWRVGRGVGTTVATAVVATTVSVQHEALISDAPENLVTCVVEVRRGFAEDLDEQGLAELRSPVQLSGSASASLTTSANGTVAHAEVTAASVTAEPATATGSAEDASTSHPEGETQVVDVGTATETDGAGSLAFVQGVPEATAHYDLKDITADASDSLTATDAVTATLNETTADPTALPFDAPVGFDDPDYSFDGRPIENDSVDGTS